MTLSEELEMTADKLSSVWIWLDSIARGESSDIEYIRKAAASLLINQEAPGWKGKSKPFGDINA